MENTPRPTIDTKLIQELVAAAEQATNAMCESINLEQLRRLQCPGCGETETF